VTARVIILLGPPGGGKGTQAVRLSAELKIPHVSTGDLFRENRAQGTELGKRAQSFMDSGKLVPDDLVLDMLFDRVARPDCKAGFLLDGFPRTIPQANALDARLSDARSSVIAVHLKVPDAVLVERVVGRRTCSKCGNIHHVKNSPPKIAGKCDKCGGELIQRSDDTAETAQKRLATYHEQTAPIVGHYRKKPGVLVEIDGNRAPDTVYSDLKRVIAPKAVR
jgi:adenylate kinase